MQLLLINQLIFEGIFKIRFCLMNVFVNGQWSMVKMPVAYYLLTVIYARIIQYKFSNHHTLFTIAHSPFTHSPIHLSMASPFSVPSVLMVDRLLLYIEI